MVIYLELGRGGSCFFALLMMRWIFGWMVCDNWEGAVLVRLE